MSAIKDFFRRLLRFFKKADAALRQVEDILPDAIAIVSLIAAATPTRSDDEIIALARDYSSGPVALIDLTRKEDALRAIARLALQRCVRIGLKDHIANAAIELAVTALKSGSASSP